MFENLNVVASDTAFVGSFRKFIPNIRVMRTARDLTDVDLVIFTGGEDVNPSRYMEENIYSSFTPSRDEFEFDVMSNLKQLIFMEGRKIKVLGVCRGHQLINVSLGGNLIQDIYKQYRHFEEREELQLLIRQHNTKEEKEEYHGHPGWHELVKVKNNGTELFDLFPEGVNSYHHQAIKRLGKTLVPVLHYDGIIEACESSNIITVQFHPEFMEVNYATPFFSYIENWVLQSKNSTKERTKSSKPKESIEKRRFIIDEDISLPRIKLDYKTYSTDTTWTATTASASEVKNDV